MDILYSFEGMLRESNNVANEQGQLSSETCGLLRGVAYSALVFKDA